jgi:hypothetical protein
LHSVKKDRSLATSFAQFSRLLAALLHLYAQKMIIQTFTIVILLNIYIVNIKDFLHVFQILSNYRYVLSHHACLIYIKSTTQCCGTRLSCIASTKLMNSTSLLLLQRKCCFSASSVMNSWLCSKFTSSIFAATTLFFIIIYIF